MESKKDVIKRVKFIVANCLCKEVNEIKYSDDPVNDLGADSLDLIDIIFAIETEFGIEIDEKEFYKQKTIKTISEYCYKKYIEKESEE